jgi:hypothetical protein
MAGLQGVDSALRASGFTAVPAAVDPPALRRVVNTFSVTVATRYGGPEFGIPETSRLISEFGRGDASAALVTAMTLSQNDFQASESCRPDDLHRGTITDPDSSPILINALAAGVPA